jgi:hypothetical protein
MPKIIRHWARLVRKKCPVSKGLVARHIYALKIRGHRSQWVSPPTLKTFEYWGATTKAQRKRLSLSWKSLPYTANIYSQITVHCCEDTCKNCKSEIQWFTVPMVINQGENMNSVEVKTVRPMSSHFSCILFRP